jgi:hypothetical protein
VALRNELLASFSAALEAIGLLDPFQVRGIVAGFWYQTKYDFLTLMARGAKGVADAWRTSIVTALEDKAAKESPLEHKLVKFLMGDFVEAIAELEAKKAELDSQIKACIAGEMMLHQEGAGDSSATLHLMAGDYAINPPGIWHTADIIDEATALFITAGWGTEHRPR